MEIQQYLLILICLIGVGIIFHLRQIISEFSSLNHTITHLHNERQNQQKEFEHEIKLFLDEISIKIEENRSNIADIKYVMDIIHDYKLPNKVDRKLFDQIEIDNEISDGIANANKRGI